MVLGMLRTQGTDSSQHGVDIRHRRGPRACVGHGGSSEGSPRAPHPRGHVGFLPGLCHLCLPVSLCTPVPCVSSKHGQLPVFSESPGRRIQQGKGWWVMMDIWPVGSGFS